MNINFDYIDYEEEYDIEKDLFLTCHNGLLYNPNFYITEKQTEKNTIFYKTATYKNENIGEYRLLTKYEIEEVINNDKPLLYYRNSWVELYYDELPNDIKERLDLEKKK